MVTHPQVGSLAELHSANPTSPREALDPLVQALVHDAAFISAVRDGALHSAAIAAVRLLKPHPGGAEFKRPADRRPAEHDGMDGGRHHHAHHHSHAHHAATSPGALALQRQLSDPRLREVIRCMRQEALSLEDLIPWTSVRRTWRNRRTSWRRQVKCGEVVPDMAARLKELRSALLTDEIPNFAGCGHAWRVQLEACMNGRGSHHSLVSVWEELKGAIKAWLDIRDQAELPTAASAALAATPGAVRAVQAMQAAATPRCSMATGAGPEEGAGWEAAMLQVPLEGILGHSREGLVAVQHAIDLERRAVQHGGGGGDPPLASHFSNINAGWEGSCEFDSGAESEAAAAESDATDMDSDWD